MRNRALFPSVLTSFGATMLTTDSTSVRARSPAPQRRASRIPAISPESTRYRLGVRLSRLSRFVDHALRRSTTTRSLRSCS